MHIIAETDIRAIHFEPLRADNLQPAADTVKLRHKPPFRIDAAAKIDQQAYRIGFIVTTHALRSHHQRHGCAIQSFYNPAVSQWSA